MAVVSERTTNSSIENKATTSYIILGVIRVHEAAAHVVQLHMVLRSVHPTERMKQKVSHEVMFQTTPISDKTVMKNWCC
jgi:hypothetical protein